MGIQNIIRCPSAKEYVRYIENNMLPSRKGYGTVWYYPKGIANIPSLHKVQGKYRVTYNSSTRARSEVHKSDGTICKLSPSKKEAFFSDVKHDNTHILVNTVDSIKNKYTISESFFKFFSILCFSQLIHPTSTSLT